VRIRVAKGLRGFHTDPERDAKGYPGAVPRHGESHLPRAREMTVTFARDFAREPERARETIYAGDEANPFPFPFSGSGTLDLPELHYQYPKRSFSRF